MRLRKSGKTFRVVLAALLLGTLLWSAGPAVAKKPPKPPPPPPDPGDSGVIYFHHIMTYSVMNPDGTEKTVLLDGERPGAPSAGLHGSTPQRWFLRTERVEGQSERSGEPRYDLYAVNASGDRILLEGDPDLELNSIENGVPTAWQQWGNDGEVVDGKVSFLGKRWVQDPVTEAWSVDEWGLFVATLDPSDLDSGVEALNLEWICHDIGVKPLTGTEDDPIMWVQYDWSPDGSSIAFFNWYDGTGVHRADYDEDSDTWTTERITTSGSDTTPRWSPDGTRIAFHSGAGIQIMDADGDNETTIVADPRDKGPVRIWVGNPSWSPNGTHLVYVLYKNREWSLQASDVIRVKADGTSAVDLTADTDRLVNEPVWRSE
jgi:hypothetical protein